MRSRIAPCNFVAALAITCETPRFLSAIVAKMLASVALLIATIAYSKSPAPTDLEGALVGRVELSGVGDLGRDVVDYRLVVVEREDLMAEGHELQGGGRSEPSETDDEDRWLHGWVSSRWWVVACLIRCASIRMPDGPTWRGTARQGPAPA